MAGTFLRKPRVLLLAYSGTFTNGVKLFDNGPVYLAVSRVVKELEACQDQQAIGCVSAF